MGLYEIMLILRPDIEAEEQEEALNGLTAVISKHGGDLSTVLDWRKRKLAYEINKHSEGHYHLVYFSGEGVIIPELEHYFRVTDAIIRYMVVSVDEKNYAAAAEKAAAAAANLETEAVSETQDETVSEAQDETVNKDDDQSVMTEVSAAEETVEEKAPDEPEEQEAVAEDAEEEITPDEEAETDEEEKKTEE
jgi:small subunit ribosomal protein S6